MCICLVRIRDGMDMFFVTSEGSGGGEKDPFFFCVCFVWVCFGGGTFFFMVVILKCMLFGWQLCL